MLILGGGGGADASIGPRALETLGTPLSQERNMSVSIIRQHRRFVLFGHSRIHSESNVTVRVMIPFSVHASVMGISAGTAKSMFCLSPWAGINGLCWGARRIHT